MLCAFLFVQFSTSSYATSSDKTIGDILSDLRDQSEPSSLAPLVEQLPVDDSVVLFSITPDDDSMLTDGSITLAHTVANTVNGVWVNGQTASAVYLGSPLQNQLWFNTYTSLFRDTLKMYSSQKIFDKGLSVEIDFKNFYNVLRLYRTSRSPNTRREFSTGYYYLESVDSLSNFKVLLTDRTGVKHEFEPQYITPWIDTSATVSLEVGLENLPFDVYGIEVSYDTPSNAYSGLEDESTLWIDVDASDGSYIQTWGRAAGFKSGYVELSFNVEDNSGLLATIIEWLRSIRDGVTNVVSAIISIPGQIWDFIESGLKALFIPDQEQVIDFNNAMDELLGDRLGALYQATSMVVNFLLDLGSYDQQGTIRFPGLDLSSFGIPFVMEAQDVQIVPESFDFVVDAIKLIVNILATLAVLNALKRRLERVFGGD